MNGSVCIISIVIERLFWDVDVVKNVIVYIAKNGENAYRPLGDHNISLIKTLGVAVKHHKYNG